MNTSQRQALERLIAIAKNDSDQGERVANYLLSTFNRSQLGAWDLTDIWSLDNSINSDILIVSSFTCGQAIGPDALGYCVDIQEIARRWRPHLFSSDQP